jgi:hypothetical protein
MPDKLKRPHPASWEGQRRTFFDSALTSLC